MANYNSCTIVGNVGADAEMRFTPEGKAVANFTVAVNENRGDESKTEWFKVTCWEKLAETCNQYVIKGMLVLVRGRVGLDKWQDKDNINRAGLIIAADKVVFLSGKKDGAKDEA